MGNGGGIPSELKRPKRGSFWYFPLGSWALKKWLLIVFCHPVCPCRLRAAGVCVWQAGQWPWPGAGGVPWIRGDGIPGQALTFFPACNLDENNLFDLWSVNLKPVDQNTFFILVFFTKTCLLKLLGLDRKTNRKKKNSSLIPVFDLSPHLLSCYYNVVDKD